MASKDKFKNIVDNDIEYELMVALYGDKWKYFENESNAKTNFHYAGTVNQQKNTNLKNRVDWENMGNAVGKTDKYAKSHYVGSEVKLLSTKKPVESNYPWKVTAHDFKLDLPQNAYIDFVVVQICMKSSKDGLAKFPSAGFYVVDNHADIKDSKTDTGWHNGVYWDTSNKKLAKTDKYETYYMKGEDFRKAGYKAKNLNDAYFGVDLKFADDCKSQTIYLKWVRCAVFYSIPDYKLTHNKELGHSQSKPDITKTGKNQEVTFTFKNKSKKAKGGTQCFKVDVPFGVDIVGYNWSPNTTYNPTTKVWTVDAPPKTEETLTLTFKDYTVDTDAITLKGYTCGGYPVPAPPSKSYWFYSNFGTVDDYGDVTTQVITKNPHRRETCCFLVSSKFISSNNNTIQFDLSYDFTFEDMQVELVSASDNNVKVQSFNSSRVILTVPPDEEISASFRVCCRPLTSNYPDDFNYFQARIHNGGGKYNDALFTILPVYEYHFSSTKSEDLTDARSKVYTLLSPDTTGFINHRIASELTTGAYVLPCRVKEHDSLMIQSQPQIHMYKWEQLDYIGCVPLEHLHFDPKSTYKDKLLDTHYKNKRYMGKELAPDEDISLKVRLHPHQVTTIQGLIDMDKPIPINANHRCFEGDALNNRGWAEIYAINTTYTNPHWYKCDIDVKYLTHNLNTRFKINKGTKTFSNFKMPKLLVESVESGDALMSGTEAHDYFIVDTDGGYIYNQEEINTTWYRNDDDKIVIFLVDGMNDELAFIQVEYADYWNNDEIEIVYGETEVEFEDLLESIVNEGYTLINAQIGIPIEVDDTEYANENERNVFTLDEGQYFNIKTKEALSTVSQISFDWTSTLLDEFKENNVTKIIRLVDKNTNNAMFEYEYSDFDFSDYVIDNGVGEGHIKAHIIARRYRKGDYEEVENADIYLPVTVQDDDEDDDDYIPMTGSVLSFYLNGKYLDVEDAGVTGQEVKIDNIELEGSSYVWEAEWKNKNSDGEDDDVVTYVNVSVQDSLLATQYAHQYSDMIVSPFPVADKELIFTRNAEEGVIYYYKNDSQEFSYLIEPYYQYHNGTDLRTTDGISIFNLNYGYKTVYLENGLVSLGINRLNGQMYLRKWDNTSKEYITLFYFQLNNYDDVNINSISDDRIELQASNTLISIYRGHPYVILKHRGEDISILNQFGSVYAEQVDLQKHDYPTYFDLLNTQNLLPACVGGVNSIDSDCIKAFECGDDIYCENNNDVCAIYGEPNEESCIIPCPDLDDVSIALNLSSDIKEDTPTNLNITTSDLSAGDKVYFIVDGDVLDQEEYVMTYPDPVPYTFPDSREYVVSAVYVGDDNKHYAIAPEKTIYAKPLAPIHDPTPSGGGGGSEDPCPQPSTGKYKMTVTAPSKFHYRDYKNWKVRLTRGDKPVCGKIIEVVDFNYISTEKTDRNGYVELKNNHIKTKPDKYKIGARFFEGATNKPLAKQFVDVEVKKNDAEFSVKEYAGTVGNAIKINLHQKGENKLDLKNTSVTIYINGKAKTKKTNENGNVYFKINKKGNYKYKCVFGGNKYYHKVTQSFKEKVKDKPKENNT